MDHHRSPYRNLLRASSCLCGLFCDSRCDRSWFFHYHSVGGYWILRAHSVHSASNVSSIHENLPLCDRQTEPTGKSDCIGQFISLGTSACSDLLKLGQRSSFWNDLGYIKRTCSFLLCLYLSRFNSNVNIAFSVDCLNKPSWLS